MRLTESEAIIFKRLKNVSMTTDELATIMGTSHQSATVRMKYLSAKVAPHGWIIENTNSLGRGKMAVYEMAKKFW